MSDPLAFVRGARAFRIWRRSLAAVPNCPNDERTWCGGQQHCRCTMRQDALQMIREKASLQWGMIWWGCRETTQWGEQRNNQAESRRDEEQRENCDIHPTAHSTPPFTHGTPLVPPHPLMHSSTASHRGNPQAAREQNSHQTDRKHKIIPPPLENAQKGNDIVYLC